MKTLLVFLAPGVACCQSQARAVDAVQDVRTVFDAGARGNAYFNARLRASMRQMGLRFVARRTQADAILRSNGDWRGNGFAGSASLTTPDGTILWRASVLRAPRSQVMAFDSLAQKLRAALAAKR